MAYVAGLFASAVVSTVVEKVGSAIRDEVTMLCSFKGDLEDMKNTLESMKAGLKDAERRSVTEESVKLWLKRLKNAAYDISDMLDEFQANTEPASGKMMGKLDCFAIAPKITMAYKMKKMRGQLRKIKEEHESFRFTHDDSRLLNMNQLPDPRETTSKVIESLIIGRDRDRTNVLSLLSKSSNKEDTTILAICGLGGIGKTTLAQLVFNDPQFKDYDHRVWVYVSQLFDLKKIGNSIISQVLKRESQTFDTRECINQRLQHLLQNKKILIILDDLWEKNNFQLNELKLMLKVTCKMRVLVTTRSIDIAKRICTVDEPYMLDPLDSDLCWSIIKQNCGFESRADKEQLKPVGQKIAGKCGGLPLAAQALGFLLYGMNLTEWEAMCNSDIWDEQFSDNTVLPSLKLSYNTLSPYLRLCFAYCGIFPKGHKISKYDLIHQWIALDFIEPSNKFSAIQLGEKYVRQFLGMSFLQYFGLSKSSLLTMHDLVHDLARSVIIDELLVFDAERASGTTIRKVYCRYASLSNYNLSDYSEARKISNIFLPKLRALHFSGCKFHGGSFSFPKCLHVLDLSGCSIIEFPSTLGQLKQLRVLIAPKLQDRQFPESITRLSKLYYLNLSYCNRLESLSESLGSLNNLQTLNLQGCDKLQSLPESLGSLNNLQTLYLSGCHKLQSLPERLGSLNNLQTLDLSGCDKLQSLPESLGSLNNLQTLYLSGCHNLQSLPERLGSLNNLQTLDLSGCDKLQSLPESLGSLNNLQTLDLSGCDKLQSLPESLGSLNNLQTLDLSGCHNLQALPESLGSLNNLQTLDLSMCDKLQALPESLGSLNNLQTLDLSMCDKLQALPESLGSLNNLQTLDLLMCDKLQALPGSLGSLNNLQTLNLSGCDKLQALPESLGSLNNLQTLHLSGCDKLQALPKSLGSLNNLQTLHLQGCDKLQALPESIGSLNNLQTLDLQWCDKLQSLPESLGSLNNLQTLDLLGCNKLQSLPESLGSLNNLQTLDLSGCNKLQALPERLGSLNNLQTLDLLGCNKLQALPESLGSLNNLQTLHLSGCDNLQSLPESLRSLNNLQTLYLSGYDNLQSLPESLGNLNNLQTLYLSECHNLQSLPERLGSLNNLQTLDLSGCDKLQSFLESLGSLNNLQTLDLSGCDKLQALLESLGSLNNLQTLHLYHCRRLKSLPESLESLNNLQTLDLSGCKKLQALSESLGSLNNLQTLNIYHCRRLKSLPKSLGKSNANGLKISSED